VNQGLRTGVLGGTFDPVHVGHLAVAREAGRALQLDRILFIPALDPPHRAADPVASPFQRFAMVALATFATPGFLASDLELRRPGPSYSAETLRLLRADGLEALQIFFITGGDAFAEIATWLEYPALLDLAHFVVCSRPGTPISALRESLPDLRPRMTDASGRPGGSHADRGPRIWLLDAATPAVSSTEVRARARSGQSLAGLVPPEVERHIRRHGLYGAPPSSEGGLPPGRVFA
jgi:nicotinate-nucleotide adenylyltransferase